MGGKVTAGDRFLSGLKLTINYRLSSWLINQLFGLLNLIKTVKKMPQKYNVDKQSKPQTYSVFYDKEKHQTLLWANFCLKKLLKNLFNNQDSC